MKSLPINVLFIEDNRGEARLVEEHLAEAGAGVSIHLIWVDRLEKGLEHIASNNIEAVLLDLNLPDSEGLDTLKRVLASAPALPVIVMTGQADETTTVQAMQAGAQDYLIKGQVDGRLLTRSIQYAIRRKQTEMQLADALQFTERILTSSPIGILTYKLTGECMSANDYAAQMVGTTVEALKSQNFRELESWKKSGLYELAEKAMATGKLASGDVHIITTFGKDAWFKAQFLSFNSAGEELLLLTIGDITEHKRAEDALRESEENYRQLFQAESDAILLIENETGRILQANHAAGILYGYSQEELLARKNIDLSAEPEQTQQVTRGTPAIAEQIITIPLRFHRKKDGTVFPVEVTARFFLHQGRSVHIAAIRDITERKRADEVLHESEERYRALFEDSPISIWEQDFSEVKKHLDSLKQQGITDFRAYFASHPEVVSESAGMIRLLDVNRAALQMYRAASKEDLLRTTSQVLSKGEQEHIYEDFIAIAEGRTSYGWEGADETLTGEPIEISLSWSVAPGHEHDFSKVIVTTIDITERKQAELELQESEERYRSLFENMLSGYAYCQMIFDHGEPQDFIYIHVNAAFEKLTGLKDVAGKQVSEVIPGIRESNPELFEIYGRVASTGNPELFETYLDALDIWFSISVYSPRQDYFVAVFDNITERRRAEETVKQSEKRFRALIENGRDNISLLDKNGILLWENPSIIRPLGYPQNEFVGRNIFQLLHPNDLNRVTDAFRQLLREPWSHRGDIFRLRHQDGGWRWVEAMASNLLDEPSVQAIVINYRDITERKAAELALEMAEAKYRSIFENAVMGIYQTTPEGYYISANPALARMYGFDSPEELIASVTDLNRQFYVDPNRRAKFKNMLTEQDAISNFESEVYRKDGSRMWVSENARTVRGEDGSLLYYEGTTENINTRKQAEESLARRITELEAINRISTALRAAESLEEMLPKVLDETLAVINTEAGTIKLYDPVSESLVSVASRGWYREIEDVVVRPGEGTSGTVFSTGKPYLAREFLTDAVTMDSARPRIPHGWGGACVPIRSGQIITGVLFVAVPLPRELSQADLNLLNTLAEMAGSAIHRMQLYEESLQQLERLNALQEIDHAISSSFDLHLTLEVVINQVIRLLKVDAADVLLIAPEAYKLEFASGRGFRTSGIKSTKLGLGEGLPGIIARELRTLQVENLAETGNKFARRDLLIGENFISYVGVPLVVKGRVKGVLEIFHRSPLKPEQGWIKFLETLAGQAAIAMDNSILFQDVQRANLELVVAYDATIEGWVSALDLRYKEAEGHTERVTSITLLLARQMGIEEKRLIHIRRGALLHDIGKMGVPDQILMNTGELSADNHDLIRKHPQFAYDILSPINYLKDALEIPYCHHERWNGTGYPRGLKGEQIPLAARIFAVVDVWDSLISDRPYRAAWSKSKARKYISEHSGTYFDPRVVELFLKHIQDAGSEYPL